MTHVLVPIAILKGQTVGPGLIELLDPVNVTVLGYHEVPEQTPPDQARAQFEERAVNALEDILSDFEGNAGEAYYRLVFTHDHHKSIERVAAEVDADAYVLPGVAGPIERLLVPLSGEIPVEELIAFVRTLVGGRSMGVTLLHTSRSPAPAGAVNDVMRQLEEAGIEVQTKEASGRPFDALIEATPDHDAIVMSKHAPSLSSLVLGDEAERVAAASVGPVFVVRQVTGETS